MKSMMIAAALLAIGVSGLWAPRWKTTDGGNNWTSLLDSNNVNWGGMQPVDFMGAIAIAPSDHRFYAWRN